jgi:hypothetical protein
MQYSLSDFPLNLNISVLLVMFSNYDAASISIPHLTYESVFHMISRIITNLAIYSWHYSSRTKKDVTPVVTTYNCSTN